MGSEDTHVLGGAAEESVHVLGKLVLVALQITSSVLG